MSSLVVITTGCLVKHIRLDGHSSFIKVIDLSQVAQERYTPTTTITAPKIRRGLLIRGDGYDRESSH